MNTKKALLVLCLSLVTVDVLAWDPVGDLMNPGRIIQNIEREAKNLGQTIVDIQIEVSAQVGAPILKNWIIESRDNALRAGTNEIPAEIYRRLRGFFDESLLRSARYRVGEGNFFALPKSSFHLMDQDAITLDYVIVFRHNDDAQNNDELWAHELAHVRQYREWGLHDFAIKYIRNYKSVENEAIGVQENYLSWRGATPRYSLRKIEQLGPLCYDKQFLLDIHQAISHMLIGYIHTVAGQWAPAIDELDAAQGAVRRRPTVFRSVNNVSKAIGMLRAGERDIVRLQLQLDEAWRDFREGVIQMQRHAYMQWPGGAIIVDHIVWPVAHLLDSFNIY